eukprot:TRINITY_DN62025_c0_g1_i1.p1 TRINITY_DN62025_c0_g1~~TRINITY_DN62025_c0_g1_i1.p1  ORF type:complete len:688 (-),score=117.19 TRINITY_DN62025_c0_g1_i1:141-2204(-)
MSESVDVCLAHLLSLGLPGHAAEAYAPLFAESGFDTPSAINMLTAEDMDRLGVKEGHKRVILLSRELGTSGAASHPPATRVEMSGRKRKAPEKLDEGLHPPGEGPTLRAIKASTKKAALASMPRGTAAKLTTTASKLRRTASKLLRRRSHGTRSGALEGIVVCLSGALSKVRREFWRQVEEHGGSFTKSVTAKTTHMVTTEKEAFCPTRKVLQAINRKTPIVSEQFILDCIEQGGVVDHTPYLYRDARELASEGSAAGSRAARSTGRAAETHLNLPEVVRGTGDRVALKPDRDSAAAARKVMLAQKYESAKQDPTNWWISEKLDGVRGYWDGKNFYSRNGNQFPAPEWFKKGLPSTPLDGELWCGRRQFRQCLSIVKSGVSGRLWKYITYWVFDAPAMKAPYEERVAFIHRTVIPASDNCPHAAPVGVIRCEGRDHLRRELATVAAKGGEGLMLRRPGSDYENKRSKVLQKVKPMHDEEAKVVGHEGGMGPSGPHCGALTLETPDGRRFSCGTGLSAADRRSPPPIGQVVTYRYMELMDNGYPRFPAYVGPRIDLDWATICADYTAPAPEQYKAGALRQSHSILYSESALRKTLSVPLDALAEATDETLEHGSCRGHRSNEEQPSRALRAAKAAAAAEARAAAARGAPSSSSGVLVRSRSELLAENAGLDLAEARRLLAENDQVIIA